MARGFGTTFGTNGTDVITCANFTFPNLISFSGWFNFNNADTVNQNNRVWSYDIAGTTASNFNYNPAALIMILSFGRVTTQGVWTVVTPSKGVWHHIALTYDTTSVANNPLVYVDGSSVTVLQTGVPVGAFVGTGINMTIGNNFTSNRAWDGSLAEYGFWNSILAASEIKALSLGVPIIGVRPASLIKYYPLFGLQTNEPEWGPSHFTTTVMGAKFQPHAPVSLWSQPSTMFVPTQTPAPSVVNIIARKQLLLPQLRMRSRI